MKKLQIRVFRYLDELNIFLTTINPDDIKHITVCDSWVVVSFLVELRPCPKCEGLLPIASFDGKEKDCPNKCEKEKCKFCGETIDWGQCPNNCKKEIEKLKEIL